MATARRPMKVVRLPFQVLSEGATSFFAAGRFRVRAIKRADGVDVSPRHVTAGEGTGDSRSLSGGLGDEADARAGDLVGVHLFRRLHALAVGDAGVVERAQPLHVYRAAGVHECSQH